MTPNSSIDWKALVPKGTDAFFTSECGSTNTLAVDAGINGAAGPSWFITSRQTAGKGRRGRPWTSDAGNLFCSYLFQPSMQFSAITPLPFITSLAVRDTLIELGCHYEQVKCKWPNDVLINEQKSCGILIESSSAGAQMPAFVVIGIGINLASSPSKTQFGATSLAQALGHKVEPSVAFKILASRLQSRLNSWQPAAMSTLVDEWSACAWGFGQRREIRTQDETFHATVIGLEPDGALNLRLDDGTTRRLYAGDVFGPSRPR